MAEACFCGAAAERAVMHISKEISMTDVQVYTVAIDKGTWVSGVEVSTEGKAQTIRMQQTTDRKKALRLESHDEAQTLWLLLRQLRYRDSVIEVRG
jgi:uncharacterized membrane protein YkoI